MTIFCFEDVKRNIVNGTDEFFKTLFQNDCILRNYGSLKIRFLLCNEEFWIHEIDVEQR